MKRASHAYGARGFRVARSLLLGFALTANACGRETPGEPVRFTVPRGATLRTVADSLAARGFIAEKTRPLFRAYARLRGADRAVRAGLYELRTGASWNALLEDLTQGKAITERMTIPEGFALRQIAPRIAAVAGISPDSALAVLLRSNALVDSVQVPGPNLEGYLFPDTYLFEPGTPIDRVIASMVKRYQSFWTPERRQRLAELGMTEREVVTLASIIQAEALWSSEMPVISGVYHNRLRVGFPLQADPTVLYALGGPRERLLYAAIDSVADSPYNTYRRAGLPPGPIGSPGELALDAALQPADTPHFYFVAGPDGRHVFTTTLAEHNVAKARARRAWDTARGAPRPRGAQLDTVRLPADRPQP
jgi:UPF0755 protein